MKRIVIHKKRIEKVIKAEEIIDTSFNFKKYGYILSRKVLFKNVLYCALFF